MCALCGVLGGPEHWTDTRTSDPHARRLERVRRVQAANRILAQYGMQLSDWQGSSYVLATATGKTELVDNLAHLWATAERLSGRHCDPLDPALLARLRAS